MTIEELKVAISVDTTIFKQSIDQVKKDMSGLQSETNKVAGGVKNAFKKLVDGIAGLKIGEKLGQAISDGVKDAINVEAATQQIKRIMGESSNQFLKWAGTQATAFNMSKSEALKYGSEFGALLNKFTSSTSDTTKYTESLLKSSAVIASSTGRTMEDVMKSISSGIQGDTEAIEELGINVDSSMLQSTEAFSKFANGKSWDQLDSQTQQQIRMFAILEQSTRGYGDSVSQDTSSQLAQLVAQLKNAQLSLGEAFLPILNIVLPILTQFASGLAYAMNIVAQFSQALFGKAMGSSNRQVQGTQAQAKAMTNLGNATEKAGKKAKGALAGFDEINQLQNDNTNDNAGSDLPTAYMRAEPTPLNFITNAPEISTKIIEMADRIKKVFADMSSFFEKNKDIIVSAIAGIIASFGSFAIIFNWSKIIEPFTVAIEGIGAALSAISWPIVGIAALIGLLVGNIVYLWRTNEQFRDSVLGVWDQIKTFITTVVSDMWNIVKGIWDKYGKTLIDNLAGFMKSIQDIIINVWESFLKPIITKALSVLTELWNNHLKGLIQQVGEFIMKLVNGALEIWNGFISPIVNWLIKTLGPVFANVFGEAIKVIGNVLGIIADVAKGIIRALGGIIDFIAGVFTGNWSKAWNGVKDIFGGIFDSLGAIVKGALNIVIKVINWAISEINSALTFDVPNWDFLPKDIRGKSFGIHIPEIPKLARGGIVDSPTIAMIGEAGKEAVVPLENTGFVNSLASAVGTAVLGAMQFSEASQTSASNGDIYLQIDGATFARIIKPYQANENQRIGNSMIVQTV